MAKVLFICRRNETRSPMAEAIFKHLSKKHKAVSAGVEPGLKNVTYYSIKLLKEVGIKLRHKPQRLTKEMVKNSNRIIILCDPKHVKGIKGEHWNIPTMKYQSWEHKQKVRDLILTKVKKLIKELN